MNAANRNRNAFKDVTPADDGRTTSRSHNIALTAIAAACAVTRHAASARFRGDGVTSNDQQPTRSELELRFDHNVSEHLGIKLYQNKPVNVLAELVANCWDADAKHVWVDFRSHGGEAFATVADDGSGMTVDTLRERYLVIGKAKRATPKERSSGGRSPMGRKGIGKLAPFGGCGFSGGMRRRARAASPVSSS